MVEVPSNILLKRLKPHVWLPGIMIGWGLVMTFTGLVTTFTGLLVARFFLGLTEAGLYMIPSLILIIDSPESNSISRVGTNVMNLAFVLHCSFRLQLYLARLVACLQLRLPKWMELVENRDGRGSYLAFLTVDLPKFLLEGIITVILGVISIWVIVDFPDDATFLGPLERYVVALRLKNDGQRSYQYEKLKWKYVFAAFKDWKLYVGMLIGMGNAGPLYAFALFLPSIVQAMNITTSLVKTQLYCVPQYACATIAVCVSHDISDSRVLLLVLLVID
jgi:hypothetical protein